MKLACYSCGHEVEAELAKHRTSTCDGCGKDLKVCLNCKHYSPGDHWDCRESISEAVREKDRANFCGWFSPDTGLRKTGKGNEKSKDARKAFDDLFG